MRTAIIFLLSAASLQSAELSVGFGEVDVSPALGKKPVFMAGFGDNRKATKLHDPLLARAVVFSDGKNKIALVSVDVVGLFFGSTERIRTLCPGYQYLGVSATHNHEGPDTLGLWGPHPFESGLDAEYLKQVEAGVAKAIQLADANLKVATAEIGAERDESLLHDSRQPYVKHDELVALRFRDSVSKKLLGILVQWNCHPEILGSQNTEISADHVGYTVNALQKKHNCPVAYFTGTVGGLMSATRNPLKDSTGKILAEDSFARAQKYGELVGELADKALAKSVPVNLLPFEVRTRSPILPMDNAIFRLGWLVGKLKRTVYEWNGDPLEKNPRETKDSAKRLAIRTEIGLLRLGDLAIPIIPGEIYPELVLGKVQDPADPGADYPDALIEPAIYAQLKSKHKMMIGLGNDELGYIIPKRQWDEKPPYCYALKKAQYGEINSLGPDTAPLLCEVFRSMAK